MIQYYWKSVYGTDFRYPYNDMAIAFCKAQGHKTITDSDIRLLNLLNVPSEAVLYVPETK